MAPGDALCGGDGLGVLELQVERRRSQFQEASFVKDHIRPAFIQLGLIDAEYTRRAGLHAFRHSLATVLITEEQVDPKTVQGSCAM
jgi:hypothetical protein